LFICRELCATHGATLSYQRAVQTANDLRVQGNEFSIIFQENTAQPWQATLH
jgi:hypothetical protein